LILFCLDLAISLSSFAAGGGPAFAAACFCSCLLLQLLWPLPLLLLLLLQCSAVQCFLVVIPQRSGGTCFCRCSYFLQLQLQLFFSCHPSQSGGLLLQLFLPGAGAVSSHEWAIVRKHDPVSLFNLIQRVMGGPHRVKMS
jgi:hypothetical protein